MIWAKILMTNGLHCNSIDAVNTPVTLLVVSTDIIMQLKFGRWWHLFLMLKNWVSPVSQLWEQHTSSPTSLRCNTRMEWIPRGTQTEQSWGDERCTLSWEGRWSGMRRGMPTNSPSNRLSSHLHHHSVIRGKGRKGVRNDRPGGNNAVEGKPDKLLKWL